MPVGWLVIVTKRHLERLHVVLPLAGYHKPCIYGSEVPIRQSTFRVTDDRYTNGREL